MLQLRVDWPLCEARGVCAEVLPEVISLDPWGYPIVGELSEELYAAARAAVKACPMSALRLVETPQR